MSEKAKPTEMTRKGFCRLAMNEITKRAFATLKDFAREAHISPAAAGEIYRGEFPGEPKGKGLSAKRKSEAGRVFTLTRICDFLNLDLDACLQACNLPKLEREIERSRGAYKPRLLLDVCDLEMLVKQAAVIGPVAHDLIPTLVKEFRSNK